MEAYTDLNGMTTILADFTIGKTILLYKKDDPNLITNYRLITLLNVDYKILTKVLNDRVVTVVKNFVGPCQTSFVLGRIITKNIMTVNLSLQLAKEKKRDRYAIFLDMEKAYNRVDHGWLAKILGKAKYSQGIRS